jgi:hypothetical protein
MRLFQRSEAPTPDPLPAELASTEDGIERVYRSMGQMWHYGWQALIQGQDAVFEQAVADLRTAVLVYRQGLALAQQQRIQQHATAPPPRRATD